MRELFWATAEKLDRVETQHAIYKAEKHSNVTFPKDGVDLSFVWDPYLNSSALQNSLKAYSSGSEQAASIFIIGGGLWHAANLGDKYLEEYRDAIDKLMSFMNPEWSEGRRKPYTETFDAGPNDGHLLILAPVQVPRYKDLEPKRAASITPEKITSMNGYLRRLSLDKGAHVAWSWSDMVQQRPDAYRGDGLHVIKSIAERQIDVVLNLRCNSQLAQKQHIYPMASSCCDYYEEPVYVQKLILIFSLGVLPVLAALGAKGESEMIFSCQVSENADL